VDLELLKEDGLWSWRGGRGSIAVRFAGRRAGSGGPGPLAARLKEVRALLPRGTDAAWLQQVHSASVVEARPGANGPGDALTTRRRGLALSVVTADCVPVLLADPADRGRIAAVHAGWRGLAQRILPAVLDRFESAGGALVAWIGPAIGPCCYEVGDEVAAAVAAASSAGVVRPGPRERPHLDLAAAARLQLAERGVADVEQIEGCTRCDADRLWSYRREGAKAGRNVAVIWRR
jgi:YfiH family protein